MTFPTKSVPSLYVQNEGEDVSTKVALTLTQARDKVVIRLTGGCGLMSDEDAHEMQELLTEPFRGFGGALLFGGTRMVYRDNPARVRPGITEVAPVIREQCPDARILGVVARATDFSIADFGLIVADDPAEEYVTIAHPNQDVCLVLQKSVDQATVWDVEYQMCTQVVTYLREYAGWRSVLVVWNGGGITEKEILLWAKNGWPVLLVKGSGRKADQYAEDREFLAAHPHVVVAEREAWSIREELEDLGVVPMTAHRGRIRLVSKTS